MFMLYATLVGLLVGLATGGRVRNLGEARLRFAPLFVAMLLVQVALFSTPLAEAAWIQVVGPFLYVGSMALMLVALAASLAGWGARLVALGGASNLAVIVANGGKMPVSPEALRALHGEAAVQALAAPGPFTNVTLMGPTSSLALLGDVVPMPAFLPFANVFSVGDVLIGLGVALWLVQLLRARPLARGASPAVGGLEHGTLR